MQETQPNLVSTIIPVHNRAGMLRQAVESVLAQTWRPIEIIISDDGSTDDTPAAGRQLADAFPEVIRYLWHPNRGAGAAREAGRQLARGELIQYLDSDDTIWPRKFEVQVQALRAKPHCGAAYGWIRLCPEGGRPGETPHKWSGRELPTLFPWLLVDRWWNTDAPLWRRSVCDAIGPWSDLRYSQDWEYDGRAGALGTQLAYCPQFVCDQRHHADNRQTGSGRWLQPQDRVRFFTLLYQHARAAGVPLDTPEMRHFARWVFLNARQCGELVDEDAAKALIGLARIASSTAGIDLRGYAVLARLLGWPRMGSLSHFLRGVYRSRPGRHTRKQSWMKADDADA